MQSKIISVRISSLFLDINVYIRLKNATHKNIIQKQKNQHVYYRKCENGVINLPKPNKKK